MSWQACGTHAAYERKADSSGCLPARRHASIFCAEESSTSRGSRCVTNTASACTSTRGRNSCTLTTQMRSLRQGCRSSIEWPCAEETVLSGSPTDLAACCIRMRSALNCHVEPDLERPPATMRTEPPLRRRCIAQNGPNGPSVGKLTLRRRARATAGRLASRAAARLLRTTSCRFSFSRLAQSLPSLTQSKSQERKKRLKTNQSAHQRVVAMGAGGHGGQRGHCGWCLRLRGGTLHHRNSSPADVRSLPPVPTSAACEESADVAGFGVVRWKCPPKLARRPRRAKTCPRWARSKSEPSEPRQPRWQRI